VQGWRVALACGEFFQKVDPEVDRLVRAAAGRLEELGARVEEVEVDFARQAAQANGLMVVADAAAFHQERLRDHPEGFGEDVRERLAQGAGAKVEEYVRARRLQEETKRLCAELFTRYDLLLTPATPITAPLLEGDDAVERARQLTRFTAPFNLTGLPALAMPCGFSDDNLPAGIQITGAAWDETRVLQAAYALEQSLGLDITL
jgi:aspartyl-tRNA(Asn)/glutamyl-tRNA(Gln) amidotransferase subunit A